MADTNPPLTEDSTDSTKTTSAISAYMEEEWTNHCPNLDTNVHSGATPQSLSVHIIRTILDAKSQIEGFIDDFARETFRVDSWEASLTEHKDYAVSFLSSESGAALEAPPPSLPFDESLQKAYELVQRRAVAIEQVTLDQAVYHSKFLPDFHHMEDLIVQILCEIRHSMIQSQSSPTVKITKDIMGDDDRDIKSEQKRNIRDAVILREYLKSLNLLHSVFAFYAYEQNA